MPLTLVYKEDSDLNFLEHLSRDDLEPLVTVLLKDENGDKRFNQDLTIQERFERDYPKHELYWDLLAAEFQANGSHTFGSTKRYREILYDVCDKQGANFNKGSDVELIEMYLLQKVLSDSLERLSPDQLRQVVKELDLKTTNFTPQGVTAALQAAIRFGGFAPYKLAVIVLHGLASVFGLVLPFVVYSTLTRAMGLFAGPIGWVFTSLWSVYSLAGPAYRVTVPATTVIACLRQIHKRKNES